MKIERLLPVGVEPGLFSSQHRFILADTVFCNQLECGDIVVFTGLLYATFEI